MSRQSSYSIYSKDVRNRTKQNKVPQEILYQKLPNRKFDIIYADPPWDYNGKLQYDKTDLYVSTSSFKYPTMKTKNDGNSD